MSEVVLIYKSCFMYYYSYFYFVWSFLLFVLVVVVVFVAVVVVIIVVLVVVVKVLMWQFQQEAVRDSLEGRLLYSDAGGHGESNSLVHSQLSIVPTKAKVRLLSSFYY